MALFQEDLLLIEYQEEWPELFAMEKARLQAAEDLTQSQFEHIGSTAVPGLAAKPIIDMMLSCKDDDLKAASELLETLDYQRLGFLYSKDDCLFIKRPEPTSHIIHLIRQQSSEFDEKIYFRDKLRTNEKVRKSYQALKLKLARRFKNNRKLYGHFKTAFIKNTLN